MVRDRFICGHRDCQLRRHLDSVPPDTPIQDIVDRCRMWESHSDQDRKLWTVTNDSRKYPTVPDYFREPSAVTEGYLAIPGSSGIEPIVLEVLAQSILDQTVNCGEKSPKISGPQLAKSW